jgi:hypothetical protein
MLHLGLYSQGTKRRVGIFIEIVELLKTSEKTVIPYLNTLKLAYI